MKPSTAESGRVEGEVSPGRRVLIVDDDEGMRRSLTRLLRLWGHQVAVAASGHDAISLAGTFQPEFAIVDVSLHDMTGLDLARRLRQTYPAGRLHLIALTAYRGDDMREGCLAAGFDTYLVKPDGIGDVQRVLE
jgi:CheY-like chemotaxis protein